VRAAPASFADEQAAAHDLARLRWAERNPVAAAESSSDSSDESSDQSGPESEEERKESDVRPPSFPWRAEQQPTSRLAFLPPRVPPAPSPGTDTPLDFFHLFMSEEYLQSMVDMTNNYAEQRHADAAAAAAAGSEHRAWQATTLEELKALMGCLIYMGIVRMYGTHDYWAATTRQPFIANTFQRNRFMELLRRLRFSEEAAGEDDRLTKVRQLLANFEGTLLKYFYPGEELSVDEAMCGFKGRSKMLQYIASKADRWGFKVWMLVDRATNYVVALDVYTGRKGDEKKPGAAAEVVLKLVDRLEPLSRHVVSVDNYFSSIHLFEQLLARGFYAVGTVQTNRKHFPRELVDEIDGKERGEWVWRQKQGSPLVATAWMDKKPVYFLTTCADPKKGATVKRWTGSEREDVACPEVVPLYTRTMRGVDVFSQRRSYTKIGRRCRKWFFSLAWFLVDIAVHNAYILYQHKHNKANYREKDFRQELMQLLVDEFSARAKAVSGRKRAMAALHQLEHRAQPGDCVQCRSRLKDGQHGRRSRWACAACNVCLCLPDCYNKHVHSHSTRRH